VSVWRTQEQKRGHSALVQQWQRFFVPGGNDPRRINDRTVRRCQAELTCISRAREAREARHESASVGCASEAHRQSCDALARASVVSRHHRQGARGKLACVRPSLVRRLFLPCSRAGSVQRSSCFLSFPLASATLYAQCRPTPHWKEEDSERTMETIRMLACGASTGLGRL
jgi:hypothetical protein